MHHHELQSQSCCRVILFGAESGEMIAAPSSLVNDEIQPTSVGRTYNERFESGAGCPQHDGARKSFPVNAEKSFLSTQAL
jgi:hypothetical protein